MQVWDDPRVAIKDRLKALGKDTRWLVEQCNGNPSRNMVYSYLRYPDKSDWTTDISAEKLLTMLRIVGLRFSHDDGKPEITTKLTRR